ncbi:MAG: RNA polymerase sigma factor [Candidatus Sulfotelmatobacter sp.]
MSTPVLTPDDNAAQALAAVFSRCQPSFYRTAFRFTGNAADAEDAVQDALLSAYKHRGQYRGQAQLATWITAIVINSARMQLRRSSRERNLSLSEEPGEAESPLVNLLPDPRPNPEQECGASELSDQTARLIGQLSPTLRQAIQLREREGLAIREIANLLGVAEGTVKARLSRARKRLHHLVGKTIRRRINGRIAVKTSVPRLTNTPLLSERNHYRRSYVDR